MLSDYLPIAILMILGLGLALFLVYLSHVLGPRRENRWKREVFECGSEPVSDARSRFSVKFYLVAILFILFDIELAFLFPWAVVFRRLGIAGFSYMMVFLAVLVAGFVYVWKRGALELQ